VRDFKIEHHHQIVLKPHQIAVNDIESIAKSIELNPAALILMLKTSAEKDKEKTLLN